ncbi:hypothetical protein, partial [Beijerinckia sp. L45]|uniref:hypothetical protein n=1 Tax=Beijerinckia sp. L45 TaxID=1641855 RepID=UPI001AED90BD
GGTPYSLSNPLLTAPAIYPVAFTDRSGTVATAGATVVDIAASTARKGGSIRAATTNTGLITITLKDASGNLHAEHLAPGESYTLTVNGYVIQVEVLVAGDTIGDAFSGVTFQ